MRFLPISILFLFFISCSLPTTKGLLVSETTTKYVGSSYFSNISKDYVYKAKIDVYGNKFGGILIIKKINLDTHRVVFTTEFGNKLFDFLYQGNTFVKNFVVEELDKKFIVSTLEKDFRLLIKEKNKVVGQYYDDTFTVYKSKNGRSYNYYFINKKTHTLDKIVNTTKTKEKVIILFRNIEEETVSSILISHKNLKLTIALESFKNEYYIN